MDKTNVIDALSALAQETRLDIYRLLVEAGPGGLAAGRIAEELDVPAATLSFHLKEMRYAGIVDCRKQGRSVIYTANFAAMNSVIGYLTENCCAGSCDKEANGDSGGASIPDAAARPPVPRLVKSGAKKSD